LGTQLPVTYKEPVSAVLTAVVYYLGELIVARGTHPASYADLYALSAAAQAAVQNDASAAAPLKMIVVPGDFPVAFEHLEDRV
jgi:hypothetical protein